MKKRPFLYVALVLTTYAGTASSQQSKLSPELWQTVQRQGVVRVIVGLNVPWQPEGNLSKEAVLAQRQAITAVQDKLLAELAGTGDLKIAACFPRAVKGLFRAGGAPLPAEGVEVINMRTETSDAVCSALLGSGNGHAEGEA